MESNNQILKDIRAASGGGGSGGGFVGFATLAESVNLNVGTTTPQSIGFDYTFAEAGDYTVALDVGVFPLVAAGNGVAGVSVLAFHGNGSAVEFGNNIIGAQVLSTNDVTGLVNHITFPVTVEADETVDFRFLLLNDAPAVLPAVATVNGEDNGYSINRATIYRR